LLYNEMVLREEVGESPSLDEYLGRFPGLASLLKNQWEVHHAFLQGSLSLSANPDEPRQGPPSTAQVGRGELPPLAGNEDSIRKWFAHDVRVRRQRGEAPGLEEYLRRFPEYEAVLRDLFPPQPNVEGPGGTPSFVFPPSGDLPAPTPGPGSTG